MKPKIQPSKPAAHSPLPWKVYDPKSGGMTFGIDTDHGDKSTSVVLIEDNGGDERAPLTKEDAELIVRAVNGLPAFDAMKKVLEVVLKTHDRSGEFGGEKNLSDGLADDIRAALSLARSAQGER